MRDYAQLRPRFWVQGTGKQFRGDREARELAVYLMSAPTSNLIGLYYLPIPTIAHELGYETPSGGLDLEGARKALQRVCDSGFAQYDDASEYVWVVNMAREQVGDDPSKADKRVTGVRNELKKHVKSAFYAAFCAHYADAFGLPKPSPVEAPSEPLPSPIDGARISGAGSGAGERTGAGARDARAPEREAKGDSFEQTRSTVRREFASRFERAEGSLWTQATDPAVDTLTTWLTSVPGDTAANLAKTLDAFFADAWTASRHFPVQHLARYPQKYFEPRHEPHSAGNGRPQRARATTAEDFEDAEDFEAQLARIGGKR